MPFTVFAHRISTMMWGSPFERERGLQCSPDVYASVAVEILVNGLLLSLDVDELKRRYNRFKIYVCIASNKGKYLTYHIVCNARIRVLL
jgi:hypothetical protein